MWGIIPAAGTGTRFQPLAFSKELLPIGSDVRMLLHDAIRDSYQQGFEARNFLRGDEPYKFSWGAQSIPKRRVILQRRLPKEQAD